MKHLWRTGLAGAAALALLMAAGCGSSSGGNQAGSGEKVASGNSSLKGSPIVVGNISSCTGPNASSEGADCDGIAAWAKSVNDAGGINGHPVKMIVKDDGADPAKALQYAKELVEQDHVIAIVGEQSNQDVGWASYVTQKGVPVVGGLSLDLPFMTSPMFFPSGTSSLAMIYGVMTNAKAAGGKMALLYCAESPQCAAGRPLDEAMAKAAGVSIVYNTKVTATATDYTSQCLAAKNAGATSMWIAAATSVVLRVAQNCAQQGVKVVQLASDGSLSRKWPSTPGFESSKLVELVVPFYADSQPAVKEYRAWVHKYMPKVENSDLDASNLSYAYVSGKLFEAAAKAANFTDTATSQQLLQGLYSLKGETLGGLSVPLTYAQGKPTVVGCWFDGEISGGKFAAPNAKPVCGPQQVFDATAAQIAKGS